MELIAPPPELISYLPYHQDNVSIHIFTIKLFAVFIILVCSIIFFPFFCVYNKLNELVAPAVQRAQS